MSEGVSRLQGDLPGRETGPADPIYRARVVGTPPSLPGQALPKHLKGTILGNDGRGNVLVRTDVGELVLATRLPVAEGDIVHLELFAIGGRLHALLFASGSAVPPVGHALEAQL